MRASLINNPVDMFTGMRSQGGLLRSVFDIAAKGLVPVVVTRKSGKRVEVFKTEAATSAYISK